MEMPGGGRRWKTLVSRSGSSKLDIAFPTVAHRPWKSQTTRFPHSHSHGDFFSPILNSKPICALRAPARTQERRGFQSTSGHRHSCSSAHQIGEFCIPNFSLLSPTITRY